MTRPPYLWHHVRHELLSPKTRLDGHHQNHVYERDKGNHLLHWRPWLDANTNLGRGGRGGGKRRGKGREERGNGGEREGEEGEVMKKRKGGEGREGRGKGRKGEGERGGKGREGRGKGRRIGGKSM